MAAQLLALAALRLATAAHLIPLDAIGYLTSGRGPPCGSAALPCPPCDAPARASQRARRNLLTLDRAARDRVYAAMDVTKALDQRSGEKKYGPDFRSWDGMVLKHAAATLDPRGDQGHGSPAYVTFHRLFLLEYERSLLAVDPAVGGLPYLDLTDPKAFALFGADDLGATVGAGGIDGYFAHWRVGNFSDARAAARTDFDFGGWAGDGDGALRAGRVPPATRAVTRYARCVEYQANADDAKRCHGAADFADWYHSAYHCVMTMRDKAAVESGALAGVRPQFVTTGALHFEGHTWLGSADGDQGYGCDASDVFGERTVAVGDFWDHRTSPNDPVFYFYHANLDRLQTAWTVSGPAKNATRATYFDFQAKSDGVQGTALTDVVAAAWPYASDLIDAPGRGNVTHADALCRLAPAAAPFAYDALPAYDGNACLSASSPPPIKSYHVHPVFDGADPAAVALALDLWQRFADFSRVVLRAYDDATPVCAFGHQTPGPDGYAKICPFPGHAGPFQPWSGDGLFGGAQYAFFVPLVHAVAAENWWRQRARPPVHCLFHGNTGCADNDHGEWAVKSEHYPVFNQSTAMLYGCHEGPPACELSLVEYESARGGCLAFGSGAPGLAPCARALDYGNGATMWRETTSYAAGRDFAWRGARVLAWNASAGALAHGSGRCLGVVGGGLALVACDDARGAWTRTFLN
ncbi:hypothetical protein JL720_8800 [Aureococcus anophagefferens]|nr:hypothetical protein JL720_8800 [Aureococcus anophagefferens]